MRVSLRECAVTFPGRRRLEFGSHDFEGPGVLAIVGPSGSGKTTLLALIGGQLHPSAGSVLVDGCEPGEAGCGWIVQSSPLLTRRSALDNVALGPLARGLERKAAMQRATDAMVSLGIAALSSDRVYRLSGGERQRVAVARTIAARTELVLADEPTASLDPVARAAVCDALDVAADEGALVIVATHDRYVSRRAGDVVDLDRAAG